MHIPFTKMHGLGNDYVFVSLQEAEVTDPVGLARRISDRHRGVGGDGLILLGPPAAANADLRMRIFNADGSAAQMCGNGVRCAGKLAFDRGWVTSRTIRIEVEQRVVAVELDVDSDGICSGARVDMGPPMLKPELIPVRLAGDSVVDAPIRVDGREMKMTCVSMGNPHAVVYVEAVDAIPLERLGSLIEHHPAFPERVNVHFVQVLEPGAVRIITWERGSGRTLACGSGACAVCVAGVLSGRSTRRIKAQLPGGALEVEWDAASESVFQRGPADVSFTGIWRD